MTIPDPHPAEISGEDAPLENTAEPTPAVKIAATGTDRELAGADRTPASPQRQPPPQRPRPSLATRPDRTGPAPADDKAAPLDKNSPAPAPRPADGGQLDEPHEGEGRQMD